MDANDPGPRTVQSALAEAAAPSWNQPVDHVALQILCAMIRDHGVMSRETMDRCVESAVRGAELLRRHARDDA